MGAVIAYLSLYGRWTITPNTDGEESKESCVSDAVSSSMVLVLLSACESEAAAVLDAAKYVLSSQLSAQQLHVSQGVSSHRSATPVCFYF